MVEKIKEIVRPVVDSFGLVLDGIEYIPHGRRWVLRIYIDKEGGATLDDCQKISVQVGNLLDAENIIPHPYLLEVSSPGLDRPLKRLDDYVKYTGRLIRLNTARPYNNKTTFTGRILSVDAELIKIETRKNGVVDIPFLDIAKARLEIEF
ncbi:MAG: ribosome maturation factor RimP [Nitrospirae bacterium]|jgi:ribosome maturation factor RimP|nr:ribosome maturation factor RimP [Nitrospirota bacterium]MBI5096820.1 ribosome maturation factor RimP [Nitrospirota bacterium]